MKKGAGQAAPFSMTSLLDGASASVAHDCAVDQKQDDGTDDRGKPRRDVEEFIERINVEDQAGAFVTRTFPLMPTRKLLQGCFQSGAALWGDRGAFRGVSWSRSWAHPGVSSSK